MTFSEAYQACRGDRIVNLKGRACRITYTTAGGGIHPPEGIANIKFIDDHSETQVNVQDLDLAHNP